MIVYSGTKKEFADDILNNQIEKKILGYMVREAGRSVSRSEVSSWQNSMRYMDSVIADVEIPESVGIAIEYKIPQTSKRIDFILTGLSSNKTGVAILIELKQWSGGVFLSDKDGIVETDFFGEVSHPSYQVWSYATMMEDYNSYIQKNNISLRPCAYLHNYEQDDVISNSFYQEYLDKAPVFLKSDAVKLRNFIKKFVKYGDDCNTIFEIENGKIQPSKALADSLESMLRGNREFILIDAQKLVYETAIKLTKISTASSKNVLIVIGGPGTGKSVVAINLLCKLTGDKGVVQYVTRNSAPRSVYQAKLTGKFTKTRIANLFSSSGSFYDVEPNTFDALIVDEAHRLNAKSGLFNNLGENQIKEIINSAKFSIFFIDEDQRVTLKDIGDVALISEIAESQKATTHVLELTSQFRCNGSDGYLAWVDDLLQIRETANETIEGLDYDFRVMDSPKLIHDMIIERNALNNKSRMLAGYCWNWVSKNNANLKDIIIGEYSARWNLDEHGQLWIIQPDSVNEVGCIHTCQGLELDYSGVIIGPDLIVRNGIVVTDATQRAATDKTLHGYKSLLKTNPVEAQRKADMIIKNTYRTLLTRGMKGCYVFSTDYETNEYFKARLGRLEKSNVYDSHSLSSLILGETDSGGTYGGE